MKKLMQEVYQYTTDITESFPLVSIDQEGGMVVRLFKDVTFPASPLTTSATQIPDAPYKTGLIIGKDMMKLGINLNLAPCLEINEDLANPLVNVRGYGATKETVLKNALAFVKGIRESKALSCIKHFPGAGSSTKDSHLELPIIEDEKEQLLNYNMYPFINLLESDALMTSHCLYKSFDTIPSTLSKVLLTYFFTFFF
jgi:beta-N-acetylhexosaminidase